jgi:hypothetical protein
VFPALVGVADAGAVGVRSLHVVHLGVEQQRPALGELERDQVLDHLGLGVDGDAAAAGERGEVEPVRPAVEAEFDAVVHQALALHPLPRAAAAQHVHGALLQDSGALALLDVVAVLALQHDAVDAGPVQQPGQQQAGGSGADDADGGVLTVRHRFCSSGSVARRARSATAKAALAAGTPQ